MEAERIGGTAFAEVITEMRDGQRDVVARLDKLIQGFPEGDIEGHRRYHEAVVKRIELRNELVKAALVKMAQAGAVGASAWLLVALWQAFKVSVTQ